MGPKTGRRGSKCLARFGLEPFKNVLLLLLATLKMAALQKGIGQLLGRITIIDTFPISQKIMRYNTKLNVITISKKKVYWAIYIMYCFVYFALIKIGIKVDMVSCNCCGIIYFQCLCFFIQYAGISFLYVFICM